MGIVKTEDLVFEYIRRDEEGNVEGITRAVDEVNRVFDTSFSPLYIVTTVFKPFEAYFFVKFYVFVCTCLYLCVIIDTRGDLLCM